jgi:transposase
MQGPHIHTVQTPPLSMTEWDALIPQDHLLRRVNKVLDFTFVRPLTAERYSHGLGRPSIDPELSFRMLLVAYLYGIASDRRLCEEVRYNLAYRWFCRLSLEDRVPDHSSLSRIRSRYDEAVFAVFFRQVVEVCRAHGLITHDCRVITDSTLIAANASIDSLVATDPVQAATDAQATQPHRPLDAFPDTHVSNHTHHSRSDGDATLAFKAGTTRGLKYKVHQTVDADSRVMLESAVTTGACHDSQIYLGQLQTIRQAYGVTIREAIAERGYGAASLLHALREQGITSDIPLFSSRSGSAVSSPPGFLYEPAHDRYRCPQGHYLLPSQQQHYHRSRYISRTADCRACSIQQHCPATPMSGHTARRSIYRSWHLNLYTEVAAQMRQPAFQRRMTERLWKIEGMIAEAKPWHGLVRAKYRGRANVQIQAYMTAAVQNIKRLLQAVVPLRLA